MANKNTRAARKRGLSNNPEITIGTGERRTIGQRRADPIVKGVCVASALRNRHDPLRYPLISMADRHGKGH